MSDDLKIDVPEGYSKGYEQQIRFEVEGTSHRFSVCLLLARRADLQSTLAFKRPGWATKRVALAPDHPIACVCTNIEDVCRRKGPAAALAIMRILILTQPRQDSRWLKVFYDFIRLHLREDEERLVSLLGAMILK